MINRLISLAHEIYRGFDNAYERQGIFLESKSLENVSRRRKFLKLRQNGILGNLLNLYIVTEKVH